MIKCYHHFNEPSENINPHENLILKRGMSMFKKNFLLSRVVLVFLAIYCLVFTLALAANTGSAVTTHLTILYDNDLHGQLLPFTGLIDNTNSGVNIGGAARRAYLMKKFKTENPNTLIFNQGDIMHGCCLISPLFQGSADLDMFEKMPYDAMVIGNHDVDYSVATLRHFIKTGSKPILSANLFNDDSSLFAKAYIIKNVGGLKIAIIGLSPSIRAEGIHSGDPATILAGYMPELKKQADSIIAITHIGESTDVNLAQKVSGIDVIVGGHSHTKIDAYEKSGNTIIVQDFLYGMFLGKLDLTIVNKKIVDQKAALIPVNGSVPDDPETAAYFRKYSDKVSIVAAKSDNIVEGAELANLLCKASRESLNTDIALQSPISLGSFMGASDSLPKGNITYNDIYAVFYRSSKISVYEVPGDLVQQILYASGSTAVCGATFNIVSGKAENIQIGGKPLDLSKTYTIAAVGSGSSSRGGRGGGGGGGLSGLLQQAKLVRTTDKIQREILIDYLKDHPVIKVSSK